MVETAENKSPGRAGFADLTLEDLPGLEILVLDEVAAWIFSPANPGKGYNGEHGGDVVTAVLNGVQRAHSFTPELTPMPSPALTEMRERVFEGVQQLSLSPEALSTFVVTLMPAVISELERSIGDAASQCYWIYCYSLLVLAGGRSGTLDQNLMIGIIASFDGWNDLMSGGFTLPWRAAPVADAPTE